MYTQVLTKKVGVPYRVERQVPVEKVVEVPQLAVSTHTLTHTHTARKREERCFT